MHIHIHTYIYIYAYIYEVKVWLVTLLVTSPERYRPTYLYSREQLGG